MAPTASRRARGRAATRVYQPGEELVVPALSAVPEENHTRFLPMETNGSRRLVYRGGDNWMIDDPSGNRRGVAYRLSKNMNDRDETRRGPQFQDVVSGIDCGDGWIRVQVQANHAQSMPMAPTIGASEERTLATSDHMVKTTSSMSRLTSRRQRGRAGARASVCSNGSTQPVVAPAVVPECSVPGDETSASNDACARDRARLLAQFQRAASEKRMAAITLTAPKDTATVVGEETAPGEGIDLAFLPTSAGLPESSAPGSNQRLVNSPPENLSSLQMGSATPASEQYSMTRAATVRPRGRAAALAELLESSNLAPDCDQDLMGPAMKKAASLQAVSASGAAEGATLGRGQAARNDTCGEQV